jgi:hypothetical protein
MFNGWFETYKLTIYFVIGVAITAVIGYGVYKVNHTINTLEKQVTDRDAVIVDMNKTIYTDANTINTQKLQLALSEGNVNTLQKAIDDNNQYIGQLSKNYTDAVANFEAWKKKNGKGKYTQPVESLLDANGSKPTSLEEILQFNKSISELNYEKDL